MYWQYETEIDQMPGSAAEVTADTYLVTFQTLFPKGEKFSDFSGVVGDF